MSLRLRLALSASLVTLVALIVLAVLSGVALERAMLDDTDEELRPQAEIVLQEIRQQGKLANEVEDALTTVSGSSTTWVYRAGKLLVGAGNRNAPEPLDPGFLKGFLPQANNTVNDWRVSSLRDKDVVVQVGRPITMIYRTIDNYARTVALVGFVSSVVAGGLIAWLMLRVTQPMAWVVDRVRRNVINEPIPGTHLNDEIGELARTLERARIARFELRERETRFLADAAHELRTPVTAMLVELDHHLSRPRSQDADRDTLERSRKHAHHLRDLCNNLLALTQAEREMGRTTINLFELASDVVDRLAPLAATKQLEISVDGEPVSVSGDPLLLSRAIENLVGNAIKFTSQGAVRVRVRSDGQAALLEVTDSGVGIAPEALGQVFEPFHRAIGQHLEGSGLGLAVVQAVVQAHGGTLDLHSQPGQGTRAQLRLPTTNAFVPDGAFVMAEDRSAR